MSSVRGGRGGTVRGRGASPFGAPAGPKTTRASFAPRARASNQVRFNAQPRGTSERGGRGAFRGAAGGRGGRGKPTGPATRSPFAAPTQTPTPTPAPAHQSNASSSFPDRFQALKKQREQERIHAIAQGFLADPDKPRTLAEAITPVGTCPDMCAEFERVERVVQKDVWGPELGDDGAPAEHRMVKKFRRAAAGIDEQLPSDLRPPSTLSRTVDYLFNDIVANADSLGSVHHFVWDRTRAIRNDFSIQQITKPADVQIAIDCYERIARFHILSLHQLAVKDKPYDKYDWYQEREQLDRTLLSLMQYYDDSRGRVQYKNEAEFRAYLIIFQAQDPTPDLDERVNTWPLSVKSDRRVRIALDLNSAASNVVDPQGPLKPRALYPVAREDWCHFFDLVRSNKVSYLMACVSEIYFKLVRRTALNAIWRGFKGQVHEFTLELMTDLLGFDHVDQTEDFCQHFGFVFKKSVSGGDDFLDLGSVQGKTFPQETPGLEHQTFSVNLVETKRMGRNFSAVISGYTVVDAQNSGLIEESYDGNDSHMDDNQVEEDPDSLFVPEDAPTPAFGSVAAPSSSPFGDIFGSTKPATETPPPSVFAQPKSVTSGFGQPSASTAFGFGKPSVSPAPSGGFTGAKPSSTSIFGQPPPSAAVNPFSSPFASTKPATAIIEQPVEASASLFSVAKPTTTEASDAQKSSPPSTGVFGSSNLNSTSPWGDSSASAVSQPAEPTASAAPSIFQAPASQEAPPKPSFGFSSTSQSAVQSSTPPLTKSSFQFPPVTNAANSSSNAQPGECPVATSLFSKPAPTLTASPSSSLTSTTPATDSAVNAIIDSPHGLKLPQFNFSQPNQPRKPSPLSQSFSITDKPESSTSIETPQATSASPISKPPAPAAKESPVAPLNPPKSKDEILEQLAKEVVLDVDRGLIRQFVEYHARQTVMDVYDELYMESIRELADNFRKETLSYRYGKRWREICWRRRLARQGRERRKRAKKDQSARELKRKLAAERDAVDDFLKSTSQATHLGASLRDSRSGREDHIGDHIGTTAQASAGHTHEHKRLRSLDATEHTTPVKKQSVATPRSNFLGFSMLESQNRPAISSTPSRSNYFRLKALGINPGSETVVAPQARKRLREDSEEALAEASPSKRSHTPPSVIDDASTFQPSKSKNTGSRVVGSSVGGVASSKVPSKALQEDEELFARARAARQAMAESGAWYRSEIQKEDTRRKEEMTRSLTSPSMERARQTARLRSSRPGAASPDIPAYRLRESRFVPREQYSLAIEKAKQKIESRSRSQSRMSSPVAANSPSQLIGGKKLMARSAQGSQTSQLFASTTETMDSMAQFAALHKAPENPAWQYESSFFAESIDPALAGPGVNGEQTSMRPTPKHDFESMARDACNEFVDLESGDELEALQQDHLDGEESEADDTVKSEVYDEDDEDEGEEYIGGYAQNPEDIGDEEGYNEEELEVDEEEEYDEYDDDDDDDDDDEETSDVEQSNRQSLPADDGNTTIKAGTGTAEDAFELSD